MQLTAITRSSAPFDKLTAGPLNTFGQANARIAVCLRRSTRRISSTLVGLVPSNAPVGHTLTQMPQSSHLSTSILMDSPNEIACWGQWFMQRVQLAFICLNREHCIGSI